MRIKCLSDGEYEDSGTVRLEGGKVVFSDPETEKMFYRVYWIDRTYTPEDGESYLKALAEKFSRSYGVELYREKEDSWLK